MTAQIHPSSTIGKNVEIGPDTVIGPNVVIEDNVKIGAGNYFYPNVYIGTGTDIGSKNEFHMGAVIGHVPQDLAFKKGIKTYTRIGDENVFREYMTVHRGTKEESATVIGNNNYFMANVHIAHNCELGNRIIMVNLASLSGYCVVEDQVFISGMVGFHQFSRIGRLSILSALSAVNKDIPPFTLCGGRPARAQGINVVGLRRANIGPEARQEIRGAFKLLYRSGLNVTQALQAIENEYHSAEVKHFMAFIRESKRGVVTMRDAAVEMKGAEDLE